MQVVQRLDAELVACEHQATGALIEQREREHAAETIETRWSPPVPGLEDDLGVGRGGEPGAGARELVAQLSEVVQLAVVTEGQSVLRERLVSRGGQVDDREAAVRK